MPALLGYCPCNVASVCRILSIETNKNDDHKNHLGHCQLQVVVVESEAKNNACEINR